MWRDESWLPLGLILTTGLAVFALILTPATTNVLSVALLFPLWMLLAFALALSAAVPPIIRMMLRGQEKPLSLCLTWLRRERVRLGIMFIGAVLGGANMIGFMLAKPVLNHLVPFWADPLLANIDRLVLGFDPAFHPSALNSNFFAIFYHRGWFALLTGALLLTLYQRPSVVKKALMATYFLLWSVGGPLIHVLLPAGGPIFYERLGYGPRFSGQSAEITTRLADYLWSVYTSSVFGAGAGISAMPSLHIATTAWALVVVWFFARKWFLLTCFGGSLIFVLSVSLGWHYAIDGLAGIAMALLLFELTRRYFSYARSVSRASASLPATY